MLQTQREEVADLAWSTATLERKSFIHLKYKYILDLTLRSGV